VCVKLIEREIKRRFAVRANVNYVREKREEREEREERREKREKREEREREEKESGRENDSAHVCICVVLEFALVGERKPEWSS